MKTPEKILTVAISKFHYCSSVDSMSILPRNYTALNITAYKFWHRIVTFFSIQVLNNSHFQQMTMTIIVTIIVTITMTVKMTVTMTRTTAI